MTEVFLCQECNKKYKKNYSKRTGNLFISHPDVPCKYNKCAYSGIEIRIMRLKGGLENIACYKEEEKKK